MARTLDDATSFAPGPRSLKHRRDGNRYVYRPTQSKDSARRLALKHLIATFFSGSASDAVAAILDESSERLSDEDLGRLEQLIDQARKEGR